MIRKLKLLGAMAGVVLAMSAVMAAAAQAQTGVLTAQQYPAIVTGEQPFGQVFDIGEGPLQRITCGSNLDATLFGPTDPVTFTPTYNNCVSDPMQTPVTITLNGCDYTVGFTKPGTTGQPITTGTMQAWVNCPAGQQIEIHVYQDPFAHAGNVSICTYDIAPQGPVPAGIYHNTMMGLPDVDATIDAKFTARSTIGAGFLPCGGDPITQHLPITMTGNYTLSGFHDFDGVEGAQQPLDVG
jgi:hypothetical protein